MLLYHRLEFLLELEGPPVEFDSLAIGDAEQFDVAHSAASRTSAMAEISATSVACDTDVYATGQKDDSPSWGG